MELSRAVRNDALQRTRPRLMPGTTLTRGVARGGIRGRGPARRGRPPQMTFTREVWRLTDAELLRNAVPRGYDDVARESNRLKRIEFEVQGTPHDVEAKLKREFQVER